MRRFRLAMGVGNPLVDGSGNPIVDSSGNPVVDTTQLPDSAPANRGCCMRCACANCAATYTLTVAGVPSECCGAEANGVFNFTQWNGCCVWLACLTNCAYVLSCGWPEYPYDGGDIVAGGNWNISLWNLGEDCETYFEDLWEFCGESCAGGGCGGGLSPGEFGITWTNSTFGCCPVLGAYPLYSGADAGACAPSGTPTAVLSA